MSASDVEQIKMQCCAHAELLEVLADRTFESLVVVNGLIE
jgi:hypothetical protein